MGRPPSRLFLEVFILKGFKSCVLEVHILKELQAHFSEVRILKEIGEGRLTVDSLKSKGKERELNTETQSTQSSETKADCEVRAWRALRVRSW